MIVLAGLAGVGAMAAHDTVSLALIGAFALLAGGAICLAAALARHHRLTLNHLQVALRLSEGEPGVLEGHVGRLVEDGELVRLGLALRDVLAARDTRLQQVEQRLGAVLAAAPAAIVVVTESGLVSLVNAGASALFAAGSVRIGTSIYAAIVRDSLVAASSAARSAGRPIRAALETTDGQHLEAGVAWLADHGGLVLGFDAPFDGHGGAALDHDLGLHDLDDDEAPPTSATRLADLPLLALDCETTGLEVGRDRIVSLGAVRGRGRRLFPFDHIDTLVDPGRPIPPASSAIHGIDDAMVAGAPEAAVVLRDLIALARNRVVVGHNIGFDLAMLAAEARHGGVAWAMPPALDTAHLVCALEPAMQELDLERIAERYGVAPQGRHTALGDALVAADIFARIVPLLADRGVTTLGDAWEFSRRARVLRAQQKSAGWHLPGEGGDG